MTTQGFFTTDLTSHELAHQWFGDDVTCASWKDISLNEGFASYLEYIYIQAFEPSRAVNWINDTHNSALVSTGSVYVDDTTDVSRIFSGSLTYNKGAFLLHMLRYEINNDSVFFEGMKTYRTTYSGKNATGLQFKAVMEQVAGMDFTDFFDQWYFGQGYPTFDIRYNQGDGNIFLKIDQYTSAPSVTPLFKMHFDVKLFLSGQPDTIVRLFIDQNTMKYTIPNISGDLSFLQLDVDQWILNADGLVSKDPSLGLKVTEKSNEISVYPNPTSKDVFIDFGKEVQGVQINVFNISGEIVYKTYVNSADFVTFSLNGNPGTYILQLHFQNGGIEEFKLVKE